MFHAHTIGRICATFYICEVAGKPQGCLFPTYADAKAYCDYYSFGESYRIYAIENPRLIHEKKGKRLTTKQRADNLLRLAMEELPK